ncbi:MAG: hypothetical protein KJ971_03785 [Firmicutes bacterium]|nr:hypothetical protein [Bacillota bacterium]
MTDKDINGLIDHLNKNISCTSSSKEMIKSILNTLYKKYQFNNVSWVMYDDEKIIDYLNAVDYVNPFSIVDEIRYFERNQDVEYKKVLIDTNIIYLFRISARSILILNSSTDQDEKILYEPFIAIITSLFLDCDLVASKN